MVEQQESARGRFAPQARRRLRVARGREVEKRQARKELEVAEGGVERRDEESRRIRLPQGELARRVHPFLKIRPGPCAIDDPGETADFELRPVKPGEWRLEIKTSAPGWYIPLPIIVVPAAKPH